MISMPWWEWLAVCATVSLTHGVIQNRLRRRRVGRSTFKLSTPTQSLELRGEPRDVARALAVLRQKIPDLLDLERLVAENAELRAGIEEVAERTGCYPKGYESLRTWER